MRCKIKTGVSFAMTLRLAIAMISGALFARSSTARSIKSCFRRSASKERTRAGSYDIPAMLLARWAADPREQGKGLGKALLKGAILQTMQSAETAGLKLLLVQAKDEGAARFFQKHGFEQILSDP